MNYEKCILNLRHNKQNIIENSINMYMKYIPETKENGIVDPRQFKSTLIGMKNEPLLFKDKKNITKEELNAIRDSFGCLNDDLSNNVEVIKTTYNNVKVEVYKKKDIPNNNPVIVNIHGGGFFGGSIDVVRNSCKLLADRACSTVVSVDYDLSPNVKFPHALNQCTSVIDYLVDNNETLKINPNKLVVMGDSAGGNLAAACCLSKEKIALQVLLYPLLKLKSEDTDFCDYIFDITEEYKDVQMNLINGIKDINDVCIYSYINNENDVKNELVSPILTKDYSSFPMTLLISPEYDYLRFQAEEFAKKLEENGVDNILYRYKGMGHAFYEHLGEFPQAEDCINEIAEAIMSL